jgi:hypothetical protein
MYLFLEIKVWSYWEHSKEHLGNLMGEHIENLVGKTLGTKKKSPSKNLGV